MTASLAALAYLVSGVLFILSLRGLSSPETSRRGNTFGMVGMALAIAVTLATLGLTDALDPLTLGLIAGLLNFIPFVGPILAFIPIGLSMIGQDWTTALIVLGGYTLIQQFDANVTTPLIQDRVVNLAPALTVIFLLFMGVALGPLGVALGTPLLAALRVLVLELYVRDVLGDTPENVD
ncbi:MAG TPA: hypothetical protein DCL55_03760 [Brevundimonas sp.]|nr:hypothetical protein [Brevundimonas sp.]